MNISRKQRKICRRALKQQQTVCSYKIMWDGTPCRPSVSCITIFVSWKLIPFKCFQSLTTRKYTLPLSGIYSTFVFRIYCSRRVKLWVLECGFSKYVYVIRVRGIFGFIIIMLTTDSFLHGTVPGAGCFTLDDYVEIMRQI